MASCRPSLLRKRWEQSWSATDLTLYPGGVIWMGTDGAPENMKDGDVINIEIDGIGTLSNPVVRER